MKKSQIKLLVSIVVSVIILFQLFFQKDSPLSASLPIVTPSNIQLKTTSKTLSATTSAEMALVTRVVDGDTIQVDKKVTVRLIGINTPETVDPRRPTQCFGKEASQKTKELLLNKQVRLEKDISEVDRYGRLLRYVYIDDEMVNETLVREGYAQAVSYPPDVKYLDLLRVAEKEARENNRGLWGVCPSGP